MLKFTDLQNCIDTVRNYDYENYLCALLAPRYVRNEIFILRAFHLTLSQISNDASNSDLTAIKLKFWENILEEIVKGGSDNKTHSPLNQQLLSQMVNARQKSLNTNMFQTLDNAEEYFKLTNSPLYQIPLQLLMGNKYLIHKDNDAIIINVINPIAISAGLTNLIRAVPRTITKNQVDLPEDILQKHNLTSNDVKSIWRSRDKPLKSQQAKTNALNTFFKFFCERIQEHLTISRKHSQLIPREAMSLFLNTYLVDRLLSRARKTGYNFIDTLLNYEATYKSYFNKQSSSPHHRHYRKDWNLLPLQLFFRKLIVRTY